MVPAFAFVTLRPWCWNRDVYVARTEVVHQLLRWLVDPQMLCCKKLAPTICSKGASFCAPGMQEA